MDWSEFGIVGAIVGAILIAIWRVVVFLKPYAVRFIDAGISHVKHMDDFLASQKETNRLFSETLSKVAEQVLQNGDMVKTIKPVLQELKDAVVVLSKIERRCASPAEGRP